MNKFYCIEIIHRNDHKISINRFTVDSNEMPTNTADFGKDSDTYRDYFFTRQAAEAYRATCITSANTLKIEII